MTWCWSTASRVLRKFPVTPTAASSQLQLRRAAGRPGSAAQRAWLAAALGLAAALPAQAGSASMALVLQFALAAAPRWRAPRPPSCSPVLPEPRRHARAAGPGEPGFRPSEERQAHRLPQRRAAGQGARAGRLPGRAWRRPAGAGRRPDPGAGAGPGRHGRQRARSIRPAKRRAIAASSPRHCSTACRAWPTCNARCPIRSRACSGKAAASWRCRAATATSARTRWCWRPASARALLSPLGHDVPLYPLKGYSLTVPLADDDHMAPAISVTDYERRIVYARVGGVLRIAAMVDIGGGDAQIDRNASRCSSARSTGIPRPGPAPGHSLPDCDRPRPRASR